MLLGSAEPHHPLHACAVVPGPVEHHDLARSGQMRHVPLEVPLGAFALGGFLEGDDAGAARVEALHEPLDRAALAGRVAALEHKHVPGAGVLGPILQLQQLDLEQPLFFLVLRSGHAEVVRVILPPGVHVLVGRIVHEHRVVVVIVANAVLMNSVKHYHGQTVSTRGYVEVTRQ
jgi:hypothetical protein